MKRIKHDIIVHNFLKKFTTKIHSYYLSRILTETPSYQNIKVYQTQTQNNKFFLEKSHYVHFGLVDRNKKFGTTPSETRVKYY